MEETQRSRGRPANYKMSRGGVPADFGPFYGIVKNNIDPTKSGRLEVFINAFQDGDEDNSTKWTTVYYLPSFFGNTPVNAAPASAAFPLNLIFGTLEIADGLIAGGFGKEGALIFGVVFNTFSAFACRGLDGFAGAIFRGVPLSLSN